MGGRGYLESDRGGEKKKDRGILGVGCCVFQAFFVVIGYVTSMPIKKLILHLCERFT